MQSIIAHIKMKAHIHVYFMTDLKPNNCRERTDQKASINTNHYRVFLRHAPSKNFNKVTTQHVIFHQISVDRCRHTDVSWQAPRPGTCPYCPPEHLLSGLATGCGRERRGRRFLRCGDSGAAHDCGLGGGHGRGESQGEAGHAGRASGGQDDERAGGVAVSAAEGHGS